MMPGGPPTIADYGLIGNTRTAALVGKGSIDWLCVPRFDADPMFGRLIGGEPAGSFSVRPTEALAPPEVAYRPHSAVLETTWSGEGWQVQLSDALVAEEHGGLRPTTLLVRRIEARGRPVEVAIEFDPRLGEGHRRPRVEQRSETLVCTWGGQLAVSLTTGPAVRIRPGEPVIVEVDPRHPLTLSMSAAANEPLIHVGADTAATLLDDTDRWWRRWVAGLDIPPVASEAVIRSLVTIRMLTYAPSGAPVASPTTSLPEWHGASRNWDYRYAWPRDASIGVAASLRVGDQDQAGALLYWLLHAERVNKPRLPPALGLDGRDTPPERILENWPGYRGATPVRVGNDAGRQHQLDGYGWVVDAAWAYHCAGGTLFRETWRLVSDLADFAADHWREPDAGIWEVRDDHRHFVHSKLMAWLALDRALRLASHHRVRKRRRERWQQERDALAADIRRQGFDEERGIYVRSYGSAELDAALLLLPVIEFDPPDDDRVVRSVDAIRSELTTDGVLVHRYVPGTDGISEPEGAFVPCSFWLVQALAATGRRQEAEAAFEQLLAHASPLGLYAEEIHPDTGEHLGNTPMVFSHATLVQAAIAIHEAAGQPGSP